MITKKIRLNPTEEQINLINETLDGLRFIWNKYLEFHQIQNLDKPLNPYAYIKDELPKLFEKYPSLKSISSKARAKLIIDEYREMVKCLKNKKMIKFKHFLLSPINSFYIIKDSVRIIDREHIFLPILKTVEIMSIDYLTEDDIQYVQSGRIIREGKKYYCALILNKEIKHELDLSDGIGISFSQYPNFLTLKGKVDMVIENRLYDDKKFKSYEKRIINLTNTFKNKVEIKKELCITKNDIYNTNKMKNIFEKINHYKTKRENLILDLHIKSILYIIKEIKPSFVTFLDSSCLNTKKYYNEVFYKIMQPSYNEFNYHKFQERLTYKCSQYGIEVRIVENSKSVIERCSVCGKEGIFNLKEFTCIHCNNNMDIIKNIAQNLYLADNYIIG